MAPNALFLINILRFIILIEMVFEVSSSKLKNLDRIRSNLCECLLIFREKAEGKKIFTPFSMEKD